ncbi:MAG: transglutaminase family protein [Methylacidiphilales bacterium]|nr:transglutaminase family protein [Candidatus Methylacidiphilales bacterium]
MKIRIQHRTTYNYSQPVTFGQHKILVRPREGHDVHIESSILEITPGHTIRWMRDVNGNSIAKVDFPEPATQLMFYSEVVLQQYDANPLDFILEKSAVNYPFVYDPDTLPELSAFMSILYPKDSDRLREWLTQFWKPGDTIETFALLQKLNTHIYKTFRYQRRDEPGVQTPAVTLGKNSGSCRDFATLMLESCRCWGLAARFVSGYMQCEATEAGGASTHAWAEVYLPGAGWKGFDPTSGIMTGAQHVTVAVSRDPEKAAPIAGSFGGPTNAFQNILVDVSVVQVDRPQPLPAPPVSPLNVAVQNQAPIQNQVVQQSQQGPKQNAAPMDMVIHAEPETITVSAIR